MYRAQSLLMRFFIDACGGYTVAEELRVQGHDVIFIGTTHPRLEDELILQRAIQEHRKRCPDFIVAMVRNFCSLSAEVPSAPTQHKAVSLVWLGAAVVLTCLAPSSVHAQVVEEVIDGDSLRVRGIGEVRLIGVDTPEWNAPFGKEASEFTRRLVEGKRVRLQYDQEKTDKYGRTLAYVYLPSGVFVNEKIIREGYGRLIRRFPFRHRDRFQRYEREARRAGRGLWDSVLGRYDDNGNGRITCAEARRHGIAPVRRGHPAYPYMHDANNDGIVCR